MSSELLKFENALNGLHKQLDARSLLKVLVAIRKQVEWPKHHDNVTTLFRTTGCLKSLLQHTQSPQKSIMDVCLSILGNCVMDSNFTREAVLHYNLFSVLSHLLNKYPKVDSVNGRTFRIIGNVCQHGDQWSNQLVIKTPAIVSHIVKVVELVAMDQVQTEEKISEATILMGLKSLRELLNCNTVTKLVKNFGALKAVGCLLIKYSSEWQESKSSSHENTIKQIIRLLQEYSRYKCYESILEMRATGRGDSLVHLSNVLPLAPRPVVKIVMNFIKTCRLQSELPIPEIFSKFIELLENNSIVKELDGECMEYLRCLCYLLDDPVNRNSSRCGKVIPSLIKVLQEFQEPSSDVINCCTLLFCSLNKFKYDDSLMIQQLNNGVVHIIIEKLQWLVGTSKPFNVTHKNPNKRRLGIGMLADYWFSWNVKRFGVKSTELREPSPSSSGDESDSSASTVCYMCYPTSCTHNHQVASPSSSSISTSGTHPSPSRSVFNEFDSDDDYSPTCSQADSDEFSLAASEDTNTMLATQDEAPTTEVITNEVETPSGSNANLKMFMLVEIIKLLKTYTKLDPAAPQLASEDLLVLLLKCSGCFEEWPTKTIPTTTYIVQRILESHSHLIPLMRTNVIETMHDLTVVQHEVTRCVKCSDWSSLAESVLDKFTSLAESGAGEGDIAHKLIKGDDETRNRLVLAIPYIIRNKSMLGKLMVRYGGLELLLELLRDEKSELQCNTIKAINILATRGLSIVNPKKYLRILYAKKIPFENLERSDTATYDKPVSFRCENNEIVTDDRDYLIQKSDFFNALLNGHFKESNTSEITLPKVRAETLRLLFHLLRHCGDEIHEPNHQNGGVYRIDARVDTLLDAITLSDKYLLPQLCLSIVDTVVQFGISPDTLPNIYEWSLGSGTEFLRAESVAFVLVGEMRHSDRVAMFNRVYDLGLRQELLGDVQRMLERHTGQWMHTRQWRKCVNLC